jgi:hypothetical protein
MKRFLSGLVPVGLLVWTFLCVPLIGCSTPPERKIPARKADLTDKGIVVGFMSRQRVGGALGSFDDFAGHKFFIQHVATRKTIENLGAGYFQLLLPPGEYVLSKINVAYGDLRPKEQPFRFAVEAGNVKYVGSVVTEKDASNERVLNRKTYILGREKLADKGFRRRRVPSMNRSEPIALYVVDAKATVGAIFRRRNPDLSEVQIVLDPMR